MRITRIMGLLLATALLAAAIQAIVLAPVSGHPDRGILPPVDQQPPTEPK